MSLLVPRSLVANAQIAYRAKFTAFTTIAVTGAVHNLTFRLHDALTEGTIRAPQLGADAELSFVRIPASATATEVMIQ